MRILLLGAGILDLAFLLLDHLPQGVGLLPLLRDNPFEIAARFLELDRSGYS